MYKNNITVNIRMFFDETALKISICIDFRLKDANSEKNPKILPHINLYIYAQKSLDDEKLPGNERISMSRYS